MTTRSWRCASSAIRSMSPRVSTPPVGFAGELRHEELRSRRDQRGQLVDVEAEVVRLADRDRDRRAADEAGDRFVDRVARVRHDHLVAGVDQGHDRVDHHALAADGHEDVLGLRGEPAAGGRVVGDRRAQVGQARVRRVVRQALVEGLLGRLADVRRGVEVGLADLEVDDRPCRSPRAPAPARRPRRPFRSRSNPSWRRSSWPTA